MVELRRRTHSRRCRENSVASISGCDSVSSTTPIPTKPTCTSESHSDSLRIAGISHAHQCAFREWHVKQRGRCSQGCAEADLPQNQKWRNRPKLIEYEYGKKDLVKLLAQARVVECHG